MTEHVEAKTRCHPPHNQCDGEEVACMVVSFLVEEVTQNEPPHMYPTRRDNIHKRRTSSVNHIIIR